MKKNEIISDAIGRIGEKYVKEYTEFTASDKTSVSKHVSADDRAPADKHTPLQPSSRSPRRRHTKIAIIASAAVVAVTLITAMFPLMLRPENAPELKDTINPNAPDSIIAEVIKGRGGESITHVVNGALDPDAATYTPQNAHIRERKAAAEASEAVEIFYDWRTNIPSLKKNTSPDSLLLRGFVTQTDTYIFDHDVTMTDGLVVSYDGASGTTSYEAYGTTSIQIVRKRTVVNIVTVQITETIKDQNTTGYEAGDTIRLYHEYSYEIPDGWSENYPPYLECASCAPSYGDAELIFAANRIKDNSRLISSAVRDAGIISGDIWHSIALCTYEGYLNGSYASARSNLPVAE